MLPQQLIIGPNFLNLALVHFEAIGSVWLVPDATQPSPQVIIFQRQALHGTWLEHFLRRVSHHRTLMVHLITRNAPKAAVTLLVKQRKAFIYESRRVVKLLE